MRRALPLAFSLLLLAPPRGADAQTFSSGSTGADGAFAPASTITLQLPADGVFNFTTVAIPAGVTVRFGRNAANTPVTILATGNVTIAGTIDISGTSGGPGAESGTILSSNAGQGGPGGFAGGAGSSSIASDVGGAGQGPGGGGGGASGNPGAGAGFLAAGTPGFPTVTSPGTAYGAPSLLPLVGGSGGGGAGSTFGNTGAGGGGGGGALVIASSGTITLTGAILARGGNGGGTGFQNPGGGGSGGAVRLIATTIAGAGGTIDVAGGGGGNTVNRGGGGGSAGRVRIEAFANTASIGFGTVPPTAVSAADPAPVHLTSEPTLAITAVGGVATPGTPTGSFATPDVTLPAGTTNPVVVALAGANIPPGTVVTVTVKGQTGADSSAAATLAGTQASSAASASVTIPTNQPCVISASASFTIIAAAAGGPVYAEGEEVERDRVTATLGGTARVAYVTRSGREIAARP